MPLGLRRTVLPVCSALVLAAIGTPAAAVTPITYYDPATGSGLITRSDIEAAYGWNDTQYTLATLSLTGTFYETSGSYYVTCGWDQVFGSRVIHRTSGYTITGAVTRYSLGSIISYPAGTASDISVYGYLTSPVSGGGSTVPSIGDQCGPYGRGGGAAVVTAVTAQGGGKGGYLVISFLGAEHRFPV